MNLALSRLRARRRRREGGAAMFVVAITLGLLAAMGVYGLSATAADIRAAGHVREAMHGQRAAEHVLMMTAETWNPQAAPKLMEELTGGKAKGTSCRTAKPYTGNAQYLNAEACLRLDVAEMQALGTVVNPTWTTTTPAFTNESFYPNPQPGTPPPPPPVDPVVRVEITNPAFAPVPPGFDETKDTFYELTATTFVEMRPPRAAPTDPLRPAETIVLGRARIVVGPARVLKTFVP